MARKRSDWSVSRRSGLPARAKAGSGKGIRWVNRPRDLPMAEELTERDFARLEAAARRQLERNRRRIG